MAHFLDFITREHILKAIRQIDIGTIPRNQQWSEYWINYKGRLYQFKYTIEVASSFSATQIGNRDFRTNPTSKKHIASLGFHIIFKPQHTGNSKTNYWISASYYGPQNNQINMFDDFIKNEYWRTDHNLKSSEGLKVYKELSKVQINDRVCIRFLNRKKSTVHIAAIGTVIDTANINNGRLGIKWDYNPPQFRGKKPIGSGAGNWWRTLFQLKDRTNIEDIFAETLIEKRVARLAWNDFGWVMPSGPIGKSKDMDTHEAGYGYGGEEWLFDTGKIIKNYHYGFLEPVNKEIDSFKNHTFDVWLHSINGETKKRYWIGNIRNLIVIDEIEAEDVKQIYINKGWLEEMKDQIKAWGGDSRGYSSWDGIVMFNVKFRINDLFLNDAYIELPENHPVYEQSRYVFGHFKNEYNFFSPEDEQGDDFVFEPNSDDGDDSSDPLTKKHQREPKTIEIVYLHTAISKAMTKVLKQTYGEENVSREHWAGYGGNKIDIVLNLKNKLTFYEIKTYNSIKTSIREAFGQLIEYCFYPNKQKAKELIIITQIPADQETVAYFKHLREIFGLPIYYQSFDLTSKKLSEKY